MVRPQLLMSSQQAVAKSFLGEGVSVVFDAQVPYADLEKKIVHLRPMPESVSDIELADIRADCDHELAHFIYTDHAALSCIDRKMVFVITNAIEDGFVERKHGNNYFGCGENLAVSNERFILEIRKKADSTTTSRRARALIALMLLTLGKTESDVYTTLGEDISCYINEIREFLDNLRNIESTEESVRLGYIIANTWLWDSPDDKDQVEIEPLGSIDDVGTTDSNENSLSTDKEIPAVDIDTLGELAEAEKLEKLGTSALRKQEISNMEFKRAKVYRARVDNDVVEIIPGPNPKSYDLSSVFPIFMEEVKQIASPLRRRLLMEFRGPGNQLARHQKKGSIDQRSLHKAVIGDPNLFVANIKEFVIDRDITLMVDCSGSMLCGDHYWPGDFLEFRRKSRLWVAAQAACACSMVLDLVGVTHEVLAWTTTGHAKADPHYERVTPLRHMIVKPSTGSFHRYQKNFTKLALLDAPAENIDGEALLWGGLRLAQRAQRRGKRPLMIVFSDGDPQSSPEDPTVLSWHLKKSVRRIESAGIATIGVGIQTSSVKKFYQSWVVIKKLTDMVGSFYEVLRSDLRNSKKFCT